MKNDELKIDENLVGSQVRVTRLRHKYFGVIKEVNNKFGRIMVKIEVKEVESDDAPFGIGDEIEVSAAEFRYTVSLSKSR